MRLTVLGGAAAGGNPGQGCSGYLVQANGTSIVLDLGPGTLAQLRLHADFRTLDAIVVSHLHLDHVLDLLALWYALAYNPRPTDRRLPLWLPPGGRSFLTTLASAIHPADTGASVFDVYDAAEYDPAVDLKVGQMTIRFAPTVHYVPCWAMRVAADDGSRDLVYTADTGPAADLAPFAAEAGVLLTEAAASGEPLEPRESRGHCTAAEAATLATDAKAERLILTHYWAEDDPARMLRSASDGYPGSIVVAKPSMIVEW